MGRWDLIRENLELPTVAVSSILAEVWSFMSCKIVKPKTVGCRKMRLKERDESNERNINKKGNKK